MARPLRVPSIADPIPADQRSLPAVRLRVSGPGLRAFFNVVSAWGLSVAEQRALLGWPASSTFHKYKSGQIGVLPYDMLARVSLVLGIYKALHILYPDDRLADGWVKLPNNNLLFGGRPALNFMVDGGMDALLQVRRLLDARRG